MPDFFEFIALEKEEKISTSCSTFFLSFLWGWKSVCRILMKQIRIVRILLFQMLSLPQSEFAEGFNLRKSISKCRMLVCSCVDRLKSMWFIAHADFRLFATLQTTTNTQRIFWKFYERQGSMGSELNLWIIIAALIAFLLSFLVALCVRCQSWAEKAIKSIFFCCQRQMENLICIPNVGNMTPRHNNMAEIFRRTSCYLRSRSWILFTVVKGDTMEVSRIFKSSDLNNSKQIQDF